MRVILFFVIVFWGLLAFAVEQASSKEKPLGIFYFSQVFGHVHQFASIYSSGLATISCGHPMKVYPIGKDNDKKGWMRVKTIGIEGYVQSQYLKTKVPKCFQAKYSKFFDALDLSATDMYYWARLPDLYIRGRLKVK